MSTPKENKSEEMLSGLQIKRIREDLGLKQADFAAKIGVDRSYLSQIENGAVVPSDKLLRKIIAQGSPESTIVNTRTMIELPKSAYDEIVVWSKAARLPMEEFLLKVLMRYGQKTCDSLITERHSASSQGASEADFSDQIAGDSKTVKEIVRPTAPGAPKLDDESQKP